MKNASKRAVPKMLAINSLVVYPEVQRLPPDPNLVKAKAAVFDWKKLGVLHVSQREDGTLSLIDGQLRKAMLDLLGFGHKKVPCLLYTGLTVQDEAELFLSLQSRTVHAYDKFAVGVTAGRPSCVGTAATCKKTGWRIGRGAGRDTIACVVPLERLWKADGTGELLSRTLTVLTDVFRRDENSMSGPLVSGMGEYLKRANGVDITVLVEKLRARFAAPVKLTSLAAMRTSTEIGTTMTENIAHIIERTYGARKKPSR